MSESSPSEPTRILLVDDNADFARALKVLLDTDPRFHVVGWANSGRTGLDLIPTLEPDIALIDFDMPRMTGLEVIAAVKRDAPAVRTVLVSAHAEREYAYRALLAGADGCVAKHRVTDDLFPLLEQLAARVRAMRRVHAVLESLQRASATTHHAASAEHDAADGASEANADVREPLKKIAALAQVLIANRARLDDEDRLLLEEMVASSRRLHWLIDTVAVYERLYGTS